MKTKSKTNRKVAKTISVAPVEEFKPEPSSQEPIWEEFAFDPSAFMSGQNMSKQWLCESLEEVARALDMTNPHTIYVLGGWYCLTNFMLQVRGNLPIHRTYSFDSDERAAIGAKILNEPYIWTGQFEAHTADVNKIDYTEHTPNIVINTSVEHMTDNEWFERIPNGTVVAIQATNMPNHDHKNKFYSADELRKAYPMFKTLIWGSKNFQYETWGFDRFMVIGVK